MQTEGSQCTVLGKVVYVLDIFKLKQYQFVLLSLSSYYNINVCILTFFLLYMHIDYYLPTCMHNCIILMFNFAKLFHHTIYSTNGLNNAPIWRVFQIQSQYLLRMNHSKCHRKYYSTCYHYVIMCSIAFVQPSQSKILALPLHGISKITFKYTYYNFYHIAT